MIRIDVTLLVWAALLILSVLASRAFGRFGIPALLVFIAIGMLAGSEGPGGIHFDNYFVAQSVGVVALVAILFDGGLRTEWNYVRPVLSVGIALSTVGVLLTALLTGAFARYLFSFSWEETLLLGSIVSSTDAAAVFSILRSRNATLKGKTQPLLELESGSNDPMAVFLTVGFIQLLNRPELSPWSLIPLFAQQLVLGAVFGYAGGRGLIWAINRLKLEYEGLYPAFTIGAMLLLYSATSSLGGSGFLAVYLAGIILGNGIFIHKNSLTRFHDGIGWISQIGMFLTLGLLVFPSHLLPVAVPSTLLALFLIFIARPFSAWLCLPGSVLSLREKTMISWVGLKGAAPIILATFPFMAETPQAELMFNVVFFVVLASVVLQGTSIPWVAKKLGLSAPIPLRKRSPLELEPGSLAKMELRELTIPSNSAATGHPVVELGFPRTALIVLLTRGEHFLIPRGDTILEENDELLILADHDDLRQIHDIIETRISGSADRASA